MKPVSLVTISLAALLAGCADLREAPQSPPLVARIEIMQPTVDIKHWPQPKVSAMPVNVDDVILPNSFHIVSLGLFYAAKCNEQQTTCRHAVVFPTVKYNLVRSGATTARFDGTFDVAIGRKLTDSSRLGGLHTELTKAIPDEVEVIEEGKFTFPLAADLQLGRPYTVEGRLGTRITVTLLQRGEVLP